MNNMIKMDFFYKKKILITGGTGSLGKYLTNYLIKNYPEIEKIIIYSRDEQKHFQMAQEFNNEEIKKIRFLIGDIRDKERLNRAIEDVDYVVHAAAMKHVHISEYNPDECVKTNINGAENLIECCLKNNVKRVVALSTDKACSPINLYGATKLVSDKLFISANNIKGKRDLKFSVVRYGNVMNSNGSVIPYFQKMKQNGYLTITDPKMTRFNITLDQAVKMILFALQNCWGGELYVPKISSFKIIDLAKSICDDCEIKTIGLRPGEKIHEEMISLSDSFYTYDLGKYYAILPFECISNDTIFTNNPLWSLDEYIKHFNAKKVSEEFHYNSGNNNNWETIESLKKLIENIKIDDNSIR